MAGEQALVVADVQLEEFVVVRCIGHRKAAPLAFFQQEIDVLASHELQALVLRQFQEQHHRAAPAFHLRDAAREDADTYASDAVQFANFERQVAERFRAAEQGLAGSLFLVGQRRGLVGTIVDGAAGNLRLAAATGTVAAAVRQLQAVAHGCFQHGFAGFDGEDAAAGLEGDRRGGLLGHRAGVSATLP